MIIDCHTHIWRSEHWSEEIKREADRARGSPAVVEVTPEMHWKAMAPVDRAVVFGFHASHLGLVVPNDLVADYVARHPDKLIGFACIDPAEPHYMDELQRCVQQAGFRGMKLAPTYQNCDPTDPRLFYVYDYCVKNHLPVLIHQGTTFARRAPLRFALPLSLEEVALAYPDLIMVVAHLGHPWIAETLVLVRKQPNVYADISALYYRPWQFYNALMLALEYGVTDKLFFGSDYPFTTPEASIDGLRAVNRIVENSSLPRIPDEVLEGILHRDSLRLMGIS